MILRCKLYKSLPRLLTTARPLLFSSSTCRQAADDGWRKDETSTRGLPEVTTEVEEGSRTKISEEELRSRQSRAVRGWLEEKMGKEKVELVDILRKHHVVIRGSNEEGQRFVEALLEWKAEGIHKEGT